MAQEAAPLEAWYLPAAQLVQAAPAEAEYLPVAQVVQEVAPTLVEEVPATQLKHTVAPEATWYFPTAQLAQADDPLLAL